MSLEGRLMGERPCSYRKPTCGITVLFHAGAGQKYLMVIGNYHVELLPATPV